jgi:hypothetical protein
MVALHTLQAASQLSEHRCKVVVRRIEEGQVYWLGWPQLYIVWTVSVRRRIALALE